MRISRHVCFSVRLHPMIALYVLNNGIVFKQVDDTDFIVFDIFEDDPRWPALQAYLEADGDNASATTIFSKQELMEAEWLTVRSKWHNGYPQPENAFEYRKITFDCTHFCQECGGGLVQQDSFRLTKAPKWGTRHFMSINWETNELFVDDTARSILEASGLTGFHFLPAKNKRGTEALPGVHQIVTEALTQPGLVTGSKDIDKIYTCAACGRVKHHPTDMGMHSFRREALDGIPDICRTHEEWGWGYGADRLVLISQRMYRLIVDNHLERSLVFEPIQLI